MRTLQVLRLNDIHLGLQDLLTKRHSVLVSCKAGQLYEPALTKTRDDVAAIPAALLSGRPLTVELSDTDARHDGFGYALWYGTEAILSCPDATPEQKAAARRIREGIISAPKELGASYATEANRAKKRRLELVQHKADLDLFPVPGGTMFLWADEFIKAGEKLDELLSLRADKNAGDRSAVLTLRPAAIALLNRFRAAVDDELGMNPALPRDLDKQLFGYLDQLEDMRVQALANEKSAAPANEQEPQPGGGTPPAP